VTSALRLKSAESIEEGERRNETVSVLREVFSSRITYFVFGRDNGDDLWDAVLHPTSFVNISTTLKRLEFIEYDFQSMPVDAMREWLAELSSLENFSIAASNSSFGVFAGWLSGTQIDAKTLKIDGVREKYGSGFFRFIEAVSR